VGLTEEERSNILRASRLRALKPRQRFVPRFAGWLAATAAIVVLVVIAVPVLLSSPVPVARASSSPPATPSTSQRPPTHPQIYSGVQLAQFAGDSTQAGKVVLSDASIIHPSISSPACILGQPCFAGVIDGNEDVAVFADWRDDVPGSGAPVQTENGLRWLTEVSVPSRSSVAAYRIESDSVVLLGPALLSDGTTWSPADLASAAGTDASDNVYVATGWLVNTNMLSCPAPQSLMSSDPPIIDWYCGGTFLTATQERSVIPTGPNEFSLKAQFDDGIHAQHGGYESFAIDPEYDDQGAVPRYGTYLIRDAGCQPETMGDCPVWRVVGRLDNDSSSLAATPSPAPPTEATFPQPSPSTVAIAMPRGVGVDLAIELARPHVGPDDATVWGYAVGTYRDVLAMTPGGDRMLQPPDGTTSDSLVWGIVFEGTFEICPPPPGGQTPAPCESRPGLSTVILDYEDGTWLTTAGYSPSGPLPTPFFIVPLISSPAPTSSTGSAIAVVRVTNSTTLGLNVSINGVSTGTSEPGAIDLFDPSGLAAPWSVTLTTESGRVLVDMTYQLSDIGTNAGGTNPETGAFVGQRLDLSCGRLDVSVGGEILGPGVPPGQSFEPGDCDP
jgi:hypothetical protein